MSTEATLNNEDDNKVGLPLVIDGENLLFVKCDVVEKKTKPLPRYTEGTLLDDMKGASKYLEDSKLAQVLKNVSGLGTAATRASIIESLKSDGYIEEKKKSIVSTEKGVTLITWLEANYPRITEVGETAKWEGALDFIAESNDLNAVAKFEQQIKNQVEKMVETLKLSKPIDKDFSKPTSKSSGKGVATSFSGGADKAPSEKQIELAKTLAARAGVALPAEATKSMQSCSKFIEKYMSKGSGSSSTSSAVKSNFGPRKPTEKQISFAESIAKKKGIALSAKELGDMAALSKWIDANK